MKRSGGVSRQPVKGRRVGLLARKAPAAPISIIDLEEQLDSRTRERDEALAQQTATSEVLSAISSSPGKLGPVFETVLANAVRICDAKFGSIYRYNSETFDPVALFDAPPSLTKFVWERGSFRPPAGSNLDQLLRTKDVVRIADESAGPSPGASARFAEARSLIAVPMLKDNVLIGAISIYRREVRPFTDKQIDLVKNFAAQAVIAIENTRLLSELRESLQQQTATADVLKVISRSTFDLETVLNTLLVSAARLCEGHISWIFQQDGDILRWMASYGHTPEVHARIKEFFQPLEVPVDRGSTVGRAASEAAVVHIPDVLADPEYTWGGAQEIGGYRACIGAPLLREGKVVGVLFVAKTVPKPFTEKQIELVKTFADQAVIAIENTRLLKELRQHTDDLSEALQQQTATADVLKVISRSTFDLQTVFDTLVETATRLCQGDASVIWRPGSDERYHMVAQYGVPSAFQERLKAIRLRPDGRSVVGRSLTRSQTIYVPDLSADPEYATRKDDDFGGYKGLLCVPMMRQGSPIGVLMVGHTTERILTEKQIALVTTFADQAVIAIENVRLFDEVQARTDDLTESLQQQTASADVLKVISRSTFDLQTVLYALVESAKRLCISDQAYIYLLEGKTYRLAASCGFSQEAEAFLKQRAILPGRNTLVARTSLEGQIVHIEDVLADPEYTYGEAQKLVGFRTLLGVPLLREGTPVGVMSLSRTTVQPFTPKQIDLVSTFADQAVIAIENVRLFEEVKARTEELSKSLDDLRTAQDRLVQTEKLASLGQLTAGIAHEIKNPLNFVNNFSAISVELIDELRQALSGANLDKKLRAEIGEIADMLQGNLDKVVQHGKRADSIVKNMLLHSRQGSGERRPVEINALVEESLNLAYHGARAEKQGFNIALEKSFDPTAGEVDLFPQEITRVLLNLISNGFYAATKLKAEGNGGDYEPTLEAATRNLGDSVEIRIRDNGTGIPPEVREKMFNPFFTTKPVGEGTGLGLSISYDIVVKQHGGAIEVATEPGQFTEFIIILPRTAATIAKSGERP